MNDTDTIVIILLMDCDQPSEESAGAGAHSRGPSKAYDKGWDRVFGNRAQCAQDMN